MLPVAGEALINALDSALRHRQPVTFTVDPHGALGVRTLKTAERFWHWRDAPYHAARLSEQAALVARCLAARQPLSIDKAIKDPLLRAGRNLVKQARAYDCETPHLTTLKTQVTAAKLGLTRQTLENNAKLQTFAEKHHIDRYLGIYGHNLKVDPTTREVLILKSGHYNSWKDVYAEIQQWSKSKPKPHQHWIYGPEGIQNKNMYNWTELKPFMKGNPAEWGHQYIFEFCVCINPASVKNGNHSWVRLKTPDGDIYSVGLYRPEKLDLSENFNNPLRIKSGNLMQPDLSEFWDFPIFTLPVAITEDQFLKMKQLIETDKKNNDLIFQLNASNCMHYCKKVAEVADIDIPSQEHALRIFLPGRLWSVVDKFAKIIPKIIQKVVMMATTIFTNLLQFLLGACRVDKNLNAQQRKYAVPFLSTLSDLFDQHKVYPHSPSMVAYKVIPEILAWRKAEMKKLETDQSTEVRRIQFGLPPKFYLAN